MAAAGRPLHRQPAALTAVFAGAVVGTALRYWVGEAYPHSGSDWPWGTFCINVIGSFVLGLLLEALVRLGPDTGVRQRVRLLAGTGFCGAFTTYSTFALETARLIENGAVTTGLAYAAASVVSGAAAALGGIVAGNALAARVQR
ncbi:putative fluoride ion transporter CrcB [Rhodococcoides trifolii]|uniref:Fluoride-specific ion channel FluC n=1 Tax=Rhodococcoides trifolii TaxID=908250 RepID=A0A917D4R2_9NOCA|nr:fluoride efflux transporter CrcB [Rhodococcus trifolii]GGG12770.1 putative fluoride ion transporter CrcB [Rhodococcus trifolii]